MSQQKAADLLQHYFRLLAQRSGVHWDSDNDVEVASIVEEIVNAAVEASVAEVLRHAKSYEGTGEPSR